MHTQFKPKAIDVLPHTAEGYSYHADFAKRKSKGVDFEALSRHGHKDGLSVLKFHHPRSQNRNKIGLGQVGRELGKKRKKHLTKLMIS
ncbi:hypothetical protein BC332_27807 [Capsicum chinense]|nr:hypothetical protein FXO37_29255 [Capsicum annuum]KAF3658461.1 hypothetical protein FXO38_13191 [Capsicum annuum]PHU02556.1 hypothetical protein BC332_27807 [Capsicum chinense]